MSHAIPNAFFRRILQSNNGSAIAIPKGKGKIHRSNDTGKARLLCRKCEAKFNEEFDKPLVDCLRVLDRQIIKAGFTARIHFNNDHLARCIASVFWRASISSANLYQGIRLSKDDQRQLYRVMVGSEQDALRNSSVSLMRLYDPTPATSGGFTQEIVSNFVFSVSAYNAKSRSQAKLEHFALDLCFQGFLIHMFIPRLPFSKVRSPRFLKRGGNVVHAPPTNILDYPPLMEMMVTGLAKKMSGEILPSVER